MATTFFVFSLGVAPEIDTVEGNQTSENRLALQGLTFGSAADPLAGHFDTLSPDATQGPGTDGDATSYVADNAIANEGFHIDGGPIQFVDGVMRYNKTTITYTDGTTANVNAIVMQDTAGNLYLIPPTTANAYSAAIEAKPIETITLGTAAPASRPKDNDMLSDRYVLNPATPVVDGTAGDDVIDAGYVDPDGHSVTAGADVVVAGAGNDSISAGTGNDTIYAGAGYDTVFFGDSWGVDTVSGGTATGEVNEDTLDFSAVTGGGISATFTASEEGTVTQGANSVAFDDIERIVGTNSADIIDASSDSSGLEFITLGGSDQVTAGAGDDYISTGSGNDTVSAGAGADTIIGGSGNDNLTGGADGDTFIVTGGIDNDIIDGSETVTTGTDRDVLDISGANVPLTVVYTGTEAGSVSDGTDTLSFLNVEELFLGAYDDVVDASAATGGITLHSGAGADTITGGSGNDTLSGGDDADTFVMADGFGNDTVWGGEGATTGFDFDTLDLSAVTVPLTVVYSGPESGTISDGTHTITFSEIEHILLGAGNDTLDAGAETLGVIVDGGGGDDILDGGTGNDTLSGGIGDDLLRGADGDDFLVGDAGADDLLGGAGTDTLDGGIGDDALSGGDGSDTLIGGQGDDTLTGGAGTDTFVIADGDGTDLVTDFDMGDDDANGFTNDQFDVSAMTDAEGNPVHAGDVVVTDTNGDGTGDAVLVFPDGTQVTLIGVDPASLNAPTLHSMGIPCFAAGTLIDTPAGPRAVEGLRPGDLVTTLDGTPLPVVWAGQRRLGAADLDANPHLRPVRIRAGALGNRRDLLLSPQHRVALGPRAAPSGFAPARWLATEGDGRFRVARGVKAITYVHLMLSRHAVIRAEGTPVESFYPGPMALKSLDTWAKARLFLARPDFSAIRTLADARAAYGPIALPLLRRSETRGHLDATPSCPPVQQSVA